MAWIRLDDDYINHPKFVALSHGAFRLWHEGMAYCRKLLTDGLIPSVALRTFRYAKRSAVDELTKPVAEDAAPLWETIPDFGYKVHDYLIWNRSKEQELQDREDARARAKKSRDVRRTGQGMCDARPNKEEEVVPESGSLQEKGSGGKPTPRPLTVGRQHPLAEYPRLGVFPFQVQRFVDCLGDHAGEFDLCAWLSALNDNRRLFIPAEYEERKKWLDQAFDYEMRQRGWLTRPSESTEARNERVRELVKQREAQA